MSQPTPTIRQRHHLWTDAEYGLIMSPPRGWRVKDLADELGVSASSVRNMQARLRKGYQGRAVEPWPGDVIDFLIRHPMMPLKQAAEETAQSIVKIRNIRKWLRNQGAVAKQSVWNVGHRRLLARTCIQCGVLYDGKEFYKTPSGWMQACGRCAGDRARRYDDKRGAQDAARKRAQEQDAAMALATSDMPYKSRHGQPWVKWELDILADPSLTIPAKAARVGRTPEALRRQAQLQGIPLAVPVVRQRWEITFPRGGVNR